MQRSKNAYLEFENEFWAKKGLVIGTYATSNGHTIPLLIIVANVEFFFEILFNKLIYYRLCGNKVIHILLDSSTIKRQAYPDI